MKTTNSINTSFREEDVKWDELAGIGIMKEELERSGEMETLLKGNKTNPVHLCLILLGMDVVLDATLQLVGEGTSPLLEIIGIETAP